MNPLFTAAVHSSQAASPHPSSLLHAPPSLPTMCDDSCSREGTRRCYRHSSSADRWEARSRLRPTAYTSTRGGSRIGRRHVSRSRMSVISGDSAGDGNRGVHQALCGGIVVSGQPSAQGLVRVASAEHVHFSGSPWCLASFRLLLVLKQVKTGKVSATSTSSFGTCSRRDKSTIVLNLSLIHI